MKQLLKIIVPFIFIKLTLCLPICSIYQSKPELVCQAVSSYCTIEQYLLHNKNALNKKASILLEDPFKRLRLIVRNLNFGNIELDENRKSNKLRKSTSVKNIISSLDSNISSNKYRSGSTVNKMEA